MLGQLLVIPLLVVGQAAQPIDFDRDVRPILADACFACHGPDGGTREAGLRLDVHEGLFGVARDGETAIIEPGNPDTGLLLARILHADADERMPPPEANRRLSEAEIALLREWIAAGAPYSGHWSFVPIADPALPAIANTEWPRNGIDHFVGARLESEDLDPAREASKRTLARRLSLDLTGLPPTPEETGAFLADDSPEAYERFVDALLASPRFGEHWAVHWLAAARYADSNGYQHDPDRTGWPWRDWVVGAFNNNMRFDEFTFDQLAGDLRQNPSESQILATGFNRNHPLNGEGGRDVEESRIDYVHDRVDATSTTWLGLTMSCAQCHDHKYDPITQKDYYSLFAFFNSIDEDGSGNDPDEPPTLEIERGGEKFNVMVMRDRADTRPTHVLHRGEWDNPTEEVQPATPHSLPRRPDSRSDRLGLADWVMAPQNPLTPRVAANRIWQQLFGPGLVRTPENFGIQGERPTHPELLDWLASRYRTSGWDTKALIRLIVTSATYRQSSACPPDLRELDPDNRLLARAPRYRLPSRVLRDQALYASGLLVERLGGPPVKPYHPDGVWEDVSFGRIKYEQGQGEDLYRRSLYTFWRRTAAPANMFDTSLRQMCSVRVIRTNTPLHALILMNDPTYAEAAAALAERALDEGGATDASRLAWAFESVVCRPPEPAELDVLTDRLVAMRAHYGGDPEAAREAACAGARPDPAPERHTDIAAHAAIMSILFNLDETITRE